MIHEADPETGTGNDSAASPDFPTRLRQAGSQPALFHCAPRVATSAREKRALRDATRADAVEMESGVIRQLCRERGIPAATVRVISDAAGDDLPIDFNALLSANMKLDFKKLARHLVLHPGAIPGLIRLRRHTVDAARKLAAVLAQFLAPTNRPPTA